MLMTLASAKSTKFLGFASSLPSSSETEISSTSAIAGILLAGGLLNPCSQDATVLTRQDLELTPTLFGSSPSFFFAA